VGESGGALGPDGTIPRSPGSNTHREPAHKSGPEESAMNGIIYIVGLIVVIMFILSFLGLR
jgi:hypothetical protein